MRPSHFLSVLLAAFALCAVLSPLARADATYSGALGLYEVGIVNEWDVDDPQRGRAVPVKIYYPDAPGPFPVIVFSHGVGGSKDYAPGLGIHWASHGYVVIHPTHLADRAPRGAFDLGRAVEEFRRADELGPDAWADRVRDLSAVLDGLDAIADALPELTDKIDPERCAVAGHSFGGYTALLAAGTILYPNGDAQRLRDPRFKAALVLSGPGRDQWGLEEDSWKEMDLPLMVMSGTRDPGRPLLEGTWRLEPYLFSPPGNKYMVYLKGAHHLSYLGPGASDPEAFVGPLRGRVERALFKRTLALNSIGTDPEHIYACVLAASTAFFDAYLKENRDAAAFLSSDAMVQLGQGIVTFERK